MIVENSYNTGEVKYIDFKSKKVKGKDYGYRVLVEVNKNSFFVIKYKPNNSIEPKSVKFFVDMEIKTWIKHNATIKPYDARPDKPVKLSEFLIRQEKIVEDATDKNLESLTGIEENTKAFFKKMDDEAGDLTLHSFYTKEKSDNDKISVMRFAFTSESEQNSVIKKWSDENGIGAMSIKFDETSIDVMSKEWDMKKTDITEVGNIFLMSLGDGIIIPKDKDGEGEKDSNSDYLSKIFNDNTTENNGDESQNDEREDVEEEEGLESNYSAKVFSKKDRLFAFRDTDTRFYIINERAVIIIMFKDTKTYMLWDVIGGEDHRIITSAKGPFDENLKVNGEDNWSTFRYDQDSFLAKVDISKVDLRTKFAEYSGKWADNARRVEMFLRYKRI